jgi:hypothetical protein
MKINFRLLLIFVLISTAWISCKKDAAQQSVLTEELNRQNSAPFIGLTTNCNINYCGEGTSKTLCAGQNIPMGSVTFNNDKDGNIYVTYSASGNWYFTELHLFVGSDLASLPVNKSGMAVPGQFPYKVVFTSPYNVQSYTFKIPGLTGDCFYIAAHSAVVEMKCGQILQSQTAWGDGCSGQPISSKGSWGTFFSACKVICEQTSDGCSFSQGYWFATGNGNNPGHAWPAAGSVTVGGYTYTEAEGKALWNAAGTSAGLRGLTQVSALKLSIANGTLSGVPAILQPYVQTIENFLSSKPKLTPSNCGDAIYDDATVSVAAGAIGDWINGNHCDQ